jgi:hypothetical protein
MVLAGGAAGQVRGERRLELLGGGVIDTTDRGEHDDVGEARMVQPHGPERRDGSTAARGGGRRRPRLRRLRRATARLACSTVAG